MVTRAIFTCLVAVVAGQRLLELRHSRKNEERIRGEGGVEHVPHQLAAMRAMHAAWLVGSVAEVWLCRRRFRPRLAAGASALFVVGQALRFAAIRTLGWRWTVRVMTIPGREPVAAGIYRHLRHPNYLGVTLEVAALPLIHSAGVSAVLFTILNGMLLRWRIDAEESALLRSCSVSAEAGVR